jgi:hypothetical protein
MRFRGWRGAPSGRAGDEDLIDRLPWRRREVTALPWWARTPGSGAPWQIRLPVLTIAIALGVLITGWLGVSMRIGLVRGAVAAMVLDVWWRWRHPSPVDPEWSGFARLFFRRPR